jgi:hypothetical protein
MSRFLHGLIHVGAILLQVAVVGSGAIPAPYNTIVTAAIAAIQGGIAIYSHSPAAPKQ